MPSGSSDDIKSVGKKTVPRGSSSNILEDKSNANGLSGDLVFQTVLDTLLPILLKEQSFCISLFTLSSNGGGGSMKETKSNEEGSDVIPIESGLKRSMDIRTFNRIR